MARADLEGAKALYPSCEMGVDAWLQFFGSPPGLQAMGKILYDIYDEVMSTEERNAGMRRIGRRPGRAAVPLEEVMGIVLPQEFTNDPLPSALAQLLRGRSQRQFAYKVPCSQSHLSRILSGERVPDLDQLERIAQAAGVRPWYFPEWRAQYVSALVTEVLSDNPHISVTALKTLRESRRGHVPVRRRPKNS